jgi:hypothetical protein
MPDKVITSTGDCSSCCGGEPPTECACALLIPELPGSGVTAPYADYATAETAIADYVVDCLVFNNGQASVTPYDTYTVDTTTGIESTATKAASSGTQGDMWAWVSVSLKAASTLTFSYNITNTGTSATCLRATAAIWVYTCSGDLVEFYDVGEQENSTSGTYGVAIASDGEYWVLMYGAAYLWSSCEEEDPTNGLNGTLGITSDDVMVVNPVIAQWDDSGTTRQLEACPRMLIPPLTESTGDWYADETEAQAAIDDNVEGCEIYSGFPIAGYTAFSAALVAGALTSSETSGDTEPAQLQLFFSFNLDTSATVTFAWSYSSTGDPGLDNGSAQVDLEVLDSTGTQVWLDSSLFVPDTESDSFVSGTLPPGRYTAIVSATSHYATDVGESETTSLSGTFTPSSGSLTGPNPVQALFDVGLTCPSRLECV